MSDPKKKSRHIVVYVEIIVLILSFLGAFYLFYRNCALRKEIAQNKEKIEETTKQISSIKEETEKARKEAELLMDNDMEKEYELWQKRMDQLESAIN